MSLFLTGRDHWYDWTNQHKDYRSQVFSGLSSSRYDTASDLHNALTNQNVQVSKFLTADTDFFLKSAIIFLLSEKKIDYV